MRKIQGLLRSQRRALCGSKVTEIRGYCVQFAAAFLKLTQNIFGLITWLGFFVAHLMADSVEGVLQHNVCCAPH